MRMADGVIYLVEPVCGYRYLTGQAVIGPTWVEYTFSSEQLSAPICQQDSADADLPIGHRVLIPLTNVLMIAIADEVEEQDGEISSRGRLRRTAPPACAGKLCVRWPQSGEIVTIAQFRADHIDSPERRVRWQS